MSPSEHEKQHKYLEPLPTSDNRNLHVRFSDIHHVAIDYVVLQQARDGFSKDSDAAEVLELVEDGDVLVRETKAREQRDLHLGLYPQR